MTEQDKQLLLQDLCARLPYGVIVQVKDWTTLDAELKTGHIRLLQEDKIELKPYLRPISSMNEKEKKELNNVLEYQYYSDDSYMCESTDWLNSHHFDYRGLIQKGLALEAHKDMYK